jgi:hypothetical protein
MSIANIIGTVATIDFFIVFALAKRKPKHKAKIIRLNEPTKH